jgi:hypothetical protein
MNILSIVITIVIIVLIIMLLRWLFLDPNTLQSLQSAQTASTIAASSLASNGSNTPSSNFAYSIWFYINDWNYRYGEPKVVFGRMGATSSTNSGSIQGVSGLDPCPAVVLGATENNIAVSLGCYPGANQQPTTPGGTTVVHTCDVPNVPIQKWVNLIVNVYGRSMDIYIDGKLVRTCLLPGVASVNNNSNIYVTPAGGFNGWTSKFQYYPNPINPQQAWNIYTQGYSSWYSSFNSYQLQISLVENGTTQKSVTI